MSKKLYIKTYGCQMNVHDSEKIADVMRTFCAMEITASPKEADVILLNTCSIREKAQEKVFSDLGALRILQKKKPDLIIGVGGCVASQEGINIKKRAPHVALIFGPQTIHRLPQMYNQALRERKTVLDLDFSALEKFSCLPSTKDAKVSALVSVMEGCNKYCSYCIVPFTRGKEVSKPFTLVLEECKSLVRQGVKEIIFLGQNVNDYKSETLDGKIVGLADLIREAAAIGEQHQSINSKDEGCIERIRFCTSYPSSFGQELIEAYGAEPKLVDHLHLPVQSGSDKILQAMRRRYSVQEFKDKLYKLREVRPNISISSDFIVGFPGETEQDFQATMDLIEEINFDTSYSFIYSPRPGTLAAKMQDDVPLQEKKARLAILQQQLHKQSCAFSEAMAGTRVEVLVTDFSKKNPLQLTGRAENNRVVNFVGSEDLIGQVVEVFITESLPNCLLGSVVGS
jgi:tRNA-2-methylthio-N6-dimethylallyladenosine synthase